MKGRDHNVIHVKFLPFVRIDFSSNLLLTHLSKNSYIEERQKYFPYLFC
jgi:hypothetical protein